MIRYWPSLLRESTNFCTLCCSVACTGRAPGTRVTSPPTRSYPLLNMQGFALSAAVSKRNAPITAGMNSTYSICECRRDFFLHFTCASPCGRDRGGKEEGRGENREGKLAKKILGARVGATQDGHREGVREWGETGADERKKGARGARDGRRIWEDMSRRAARERRGALVAWGRGKDVRI